MPGGPLLFCAQQRFKFHGAISGTADAADANIRVAAASVLEGDHDCYLLHYDSYYYYIYICTNGICVCVYNYIFFDWFLKKKHCERVKEQQWLLGRGEDSHQLRLFGHLPPPVEDFVGRGHRGGAVPSYGADRDGLFGSLQGLSIAFQRNNSGRRVAHT